MYAVKRSMSVIKETGDRTFTGPGADGEIIVALTDALTRGLRIQ